MRDYGVFNREREVSGYCFVVKTLKVEFYIEKQINQVKQFSTAVQGIY